MTTKITDIKTVGDVMKRLYENKNIYETRHTFMCQILGVLHEHVLSSSELTITLKCFIELEAKNRELTGKAREGT